MNSTINRALRVAWRGCKALAEAFIIALIIGAPFAYYFWSMTP